MYYDDDILLPLSMGQGRTIAQNASGQKEELKEDCSLSSKRVKLFSHTSQEICHKNCFAIPNKAKIKLQISDI